MANGDKPFRWRVLEQRHTVEVTAGGQFQDVMEVTVETASGTTFPIRIPLRNYSDQAVAALADAYSRAIEDVAGLEGP